MQLSTLWDLFQMSYIWNNYLFLTGHAALQWHLVATSNQSNSGCQRYQCLLRGNVNQLLNLLLMFYSLSSKIKTYPLTQPPPKIAILSHLVDLYNIKNICFLTFHLNSNSNIWNYFLYQLWELECYMKGKNCYIIKHTLFQNFNLWAWF